MTQRHTPKFTNFSQTSSLLPSWCRAHRCPLPQSMSLSSHPKEIQLATPEPVVNSHQTLLKKTIQETPHRQHLFLSPPPSRLLVQLLWGSRVQRDYCASQWTEWTLARSCKQPGARVTGPLFPGLPSSSPQHYRGQSRQRWGDPVLSQNS